MIKSKRAQEEIVGFVVIIIIVSVILLILLWFMLRTPDKNAVEDYEVESFIQATLQYTSNCESGVGFLPVRDLIVACEQKENCLDEKYSCLALNETLKDIIQTGWNVGTQSAIKGYKFSVMAGEQGIFLLQEGNETRNYKGAFQNFARGSESYDVSLNVYSYILM